MAVDWSYFNKFEKINDKYLPWRGEGDTMATQIVTAVCKLVYKWYNDGDVFDNTYHLDGWCNDLSSYANWLDKYTDAGHILHKISDCWNHSDYEDLLKELADTLLVDDYLIKQNEIGAIGTIYKCNGSFEFSEWSNPLLFLFENIVFKKNYHSRQEEMKSEMQSQDKESSCFARRK